MPVSAHAQRYRGTSRDGHSASPGDWHCSPSPPVKFSRHALSLCALITSGSLIFFFLSAVLVSCELFYIRTKRESKRILEVIPKRLWVGISEWAGQAASLGRKDSEFLRGSVSSGFQEEFSAIRFLGLTDKYPFFCYLLYNYKH